MNKKQITNLHSTLKSSFKAVSDDITKLKKRDSALRTEIDDLKKIAPNTVSRDEFFEYIKKVDDQMNRAIDIDSLTKTEETLSRSISDVTKKFDSDVSELSSNVQSNKDEIVKRMDSMEKEFKKMFESIKSDMKKTEDLKKEVKEVRSFKKQVEDLERTFAKKKELDECFSEQDEIYDLIEDLESKILKKKDVEAFQKLVDDKLMKFKSQVNDVETVSEKLNAKMKDLDDYDRNISSLNDFSEKMTEKVAKIDKAEAIARLALKLKENAEVMKSFETKLNELVEIINKERDYEVEKMVESSYYEDSEIEDIEPEKIEVPKIKLPEPKPLKIKPAPKIIIPETKKEVVKSKPTEIKIDLDKAKVEEFGEESKKKGLFGKIVDFFFEEVPESEEADSEPKKVIIEKKVSEKNDVKTEKVKVEIKSMKKEESKKVEKKEEPRESKKSEKKIESEAEPKKSEEHVIPVPKSSEHMAEDKPKKKGIFGRIVDWFLEDDEEDEMDDIPKSESKKDKEESKKDSKDSKDSKSEEKKDSKKEN